jgi:hypothetical protein
MKKFLKIKYLIILLIVIQFYRPSQNVQKITPKTNIFKVEQASEDVQDLIATSCYDCHSNNTVYPWYNKIAPVSWWLANHIDEGKEELNFDAWGTYSLKRKNKKLKEIKKQLEEREMPLESYLWIHKDAKLTQDQIKIIIDWARTLNPDIDKKEVRRER